MTFQTPFTDLRYAAMQQQGLHTKGLHMKIVILGAGVIGVTSAWYLAKAGHEVTVIDRQPGPALETSFGNVAKSAPVMPALGQPPASPPRR